MTLQKLLLKTCSFGPSQTILRSRTWRVESGVGKGLRIRFPQNTDYIWGTNELPVQNTLADQLKPGDVFYDIGANVGFFSLIAARLIGETGQVYSFEPVTEHANAIRANAALNSMSHIEVHEIALGNVKGHGELLLTEWDGGASLSTSPVKPETPRQKRSVDILPLDELVQTEKLLPPAMIKIDVEGLESDVLQGASQTIRQHKPTLLYEVDDGNKEAFVSRWKDLDEYVEGFGYEVIHLENSYTAIMWNVGHAVAIAKSSHGRKA